MPRAGLSGNVAMLPLVVFLLASGAVLSRWMKIFALLPATVIAWLVAALLAWKEGFSVEQTLGAAFVCGSGLQLGYLLGLVFAK